MPSPGANVRTNPLRVALARMLEYTPAPLLAWVHRHPLLYARIAPRVRRLMHSGPDMLVTIPDGPNQGRKMLMYPGIPLAYWLAGEWERDVQEAMRANVRPGMVVADIGSHAGYWTLALSRWTGESGRVLSFEPNPATMRRLRRTCEINDLRNVELFEVAASDRTGEASFIGFDDELSPSSRIAGAGSAGEPGSVRVRTARLDDLWSERGLPEPHFVKLDVEDHEVAVLRGARELLRRARPCLLIEIHSFASLQGCVAELLPLGYRLTPLTDQPLYEAVIGGTLAPGAAEPAGFEGAHILAKVEPSAR